MSAPPPPQPRTPRRGKVVVALVLVLALAVSGLGLAGYAAWAFLHEKRGPDGFPSPPPPTPAIAAPTYPAALAKFYEQDLSWHRCGEDQCTRLTVPLDYAAPEGRTIKLSVLRDPASKRSKRIGQLVVNPGGPGGSGVDYAAAGSDAFGEELTRYFDIVGFDPRGVAQSTPLECAGTAQTDEFLSADSDPDTPAEVTRFEQLTRKFGEGCLARSGALARHISTVEVAKDLDVLRAALGEPKLDYLGASYGTFLGATYADLFPTHVRRMVLDGAVDPALSGPQLALNQASGFETALRAYLQRCVDRGSCFLGDTLEEGQQRISRLFEELDKKPIPTSSGRDLTEALAVFGVITPLYDKRSWPVLTTALKAALGGNGDVLLQLSDQYTSRGLNRYTSNSMATLNAVTCLDHDDGLAPNELSSRFAAFDKASPTFGRVFAYGLLSCRAWPIHSGRKASALHAEGAPPIVVIGTTRDPATPYEQAVDLAKELRSGVLISRDGDGHTGFGMGNACVDRAVQRFLLGGTVPKDGLSC